jgi:hypothetical protein
LEQEYPINQVFLLIKSPFRKRILRGKNQVPLPYVTYAAVPIAAVDDKSRLALTSLHNAVCFLKTSSPFAPTEVLGSEVEEEEEEEADEMAAATAGVVDSV